MSDTRRGEIEAMFRDYGEGVGSFVLARVGDAELAEEITARVFVTVVRQFAQCHTSRQAWLWTIVRHEISRHYRRERALAPIPAEFPAKTEGPLEQIAARETHAHMRAALAQLPEQQQQIVYLKFFLNRSNVEIAESMRLTAGNVGTLLFRSLKELRRLMRPHETEADHEHAAR